MASKQSDFSVCTTWLVADSGYFLLDVFRERLDFPGLCKAAHEQAEVWNADTVLIEDTSSGTALLQTLTSGPLAGGFGVVAVRLEGKIVYRVARD